MAWNSPMTAIAGGVVSAADFNQFIRDNLNVSEGALSLTPSGYMAVTGAHTIAERVPANDFITTQETTTSTTYTNLATVRPTCTSPRALRPLSSSGEGSVRILEQRPQ